MHKIFKKVLFTFILFIGFSGVKAEEITDGVYTIKSALNENKVVEIVDGQIVSGGNIQINQNKNTDNQKWNIKKVDDYYEISSVLYDSLVFDVAGGGKTSGTNVWAYISNKTNAQKWYIKETEDGYYSIVSKLNDLYLDIANGSSSNGANVQVYAGNNTNAQKFKLVKEEESIQTIEDGDYVIETSLNSNKAIDLSAGSIIENNKIQIYTKNETEAQFWSFKYDGNGYYTISSPLDNTKGLGKNGSRVLFNTITNNNQKWIVKKIGDGYYYIVSADGHKYLDVSGGSSSDGTAIGLYQGNNTNAQKFKLVKEENIEGTQSISDGNYVIESALQSGKVLDLTSGSTINGNSIQLYSKNNTKAQIWNVKYDGAGYYSITSYLADNKGFECSNRVSGQSVLINEVNNTKHKWIIKDLGNGYYSIVTPGRHKYLDISGGSTANGTKVQVYTGNGTNSQKFKFIKREIKDLEDGLYTISDSSGKVVSVSGDIAYSGANVVLQNNENKNTQKWYVKKIGDELYSITSATNTSQSLDVAGGGTSNGTNVQTYKSNNTDAQKWYLKSDGDGYYHIEAKNSYLDLNISNDNINTWEESDVSSQKFKFTKSDLNIYEKSYEDGYYQIASVINDNLVLDAASGVTGNNTNVWLYSNNNSNAQIWYFKYISNGVYSITSAMNRNVSLNVSGYNVDIYKNYNADTQQWFLKDYGDGTVSIISKSNGLYIDVENGMATSGSNIQIYSGNDTKAQRFKLIKNTSKKIYKGIDVSSHQKTIDWSKVYNSGINFAIIRAGYGSYYEDVNQEDEQFINNVAACEKYNIPYAVYLYSYAEGNSGVNSASSEAQHTLLLLQKLKALGYTPTLGTNVFYDMEDASTVKGDKAYMNSLAHDYCKIIENAGYKCGIYANKTWLESVLDATDLASSYAIWLAHYTGPDTYSEAKASSYNLTSYKYWQFSSMGSVNGINGYVDLDFGFDIFD